LHLVPFQVPQLAEGFPPGAVVETRLRKVMPAHQQARGCAMPSDRDGMPAALRGLLEECEAELRRHDIGGVSLGQVYAKVRVALDELEQLRLDGVRFAPQVRLFGPR
jgi:hypothetical protein